MSDIDHSSKPSAPFEVRRLARTLWNWFDQTVAWHEARVSNGPTEGMNNLLKRVKRVAFGFTNFQNFRVRALLYAGKPNFRVLDSMVVT
jgi:transposase